MLKGFFVVEGNTVTHHGSSGAPSKELLVAAHALASTFGCPWADQASQSCRAWPCSGPQLVHCVMVMLSREAEGRVCRICGCTDGFGCLEGCSWVEEDLCSSCVDWKDVDMSVSALESGISARETS